MKLVLENNILENNVSHTVLGNNVQEKNISEHNITNFISYLLCYEIQGHNGFTINRPRSMTVILHCRVGSCGRRQRF